MLVWFSVGLLFPFELEGCANFSCSFVVGVLDISAALLFGDGLQSHGLRDAVMMNYSLSGARRASVVSISSVSPM